MVSSKSNLNLRLASPADRERISWLIRKESFVHKHLNWGAIFDLLGRQPFLLLERDDQLIAALACPPDNDQNSWLELFAVEPGESLYLCWNKLWESAVQSLKLSGFSGSVSSLVIREEIKKLLKDSGFMKIDQVVVLVWENTQASWPKPNQEAVVRLMLNEDFPKVHEVDQLAFGLIWRNSISQLKAAYEAAFSATVVEIDGEIQGYQISTVNPQGGHLGRLAVNPAYQKRGLGGRLLTDLLDRFQDRGILEVTVNTQLSNQRSLDFYRKFGFKQLDRQYPVFQYLID
jgi:ribosomal-protein-alanine N-acetyltransferase